MGEEVKTKVKSFFSDFFQYLISVGSAAVIIFYVLKYSFGVPADIKSNNKKLTTIEEKVDTSLAMNSFIMNSVYDLEKKQEKLYGVVTETNDLIKNNTRELNNLKRVVYSKLESNNDSQFKPKTVIPLNEAMDSFFKKRSTRH